MVLEALTSFLGIFIVFITLRSLKQFSELTNSYQKLPAQVAIFFGLWLIYLSVISYSEILIDFSLPPKMPLLVVMPIFIVIIISLFKKATSDFVAVTSVSWLIYIQGFRILVELIIWGGYTIGIMPVIATFEGLNIDVVVGITAVPMAYYAKREKVSSKALIIWNIAGLLILANTVRVIIMAAYLPNFLGIEPGVIGGDFVKLPFLLIAGLFMPFAVFVHALSIKQLLGKEKQARFN